MTLFCVWEEGDRSAARKVIPSVAHALERIVRVDATAVIAGPG